MPSLPLLLLFLSALLSGVHCDYWENRTRHVARLSPLQPLIRRDVQSRETTIRGLLGVRQLYCGPGLEVCSNQGCCTPEENCCSDGGCCGAGQYCDLGGCCPDGEVCEGTSDTCSESGFSICPNDDYCCPTGQTCVRNADGSPGCEDSSGGGGGGNTSPTTTPKGGNSPTTTTRKTVSTPGRTTTDINTTPHTESSETTALNTGPTPTPGAGNPTGGTQESAFNPLPTSLSGAPTQGSSSSGDSTAPSSAAPRTTVFLVPLALLLTLLTSFSVPFF